MKGFGSLVAVLLLLGVVGLVAAEQNASVSVQADAQAGLTVSPSSTASAEPTAPALDIRKKNRERLDDIRDTINERREGIRERRGDVRDKMQELREKMAQMRETYQEALNKANAKVADLQQRVKALRAKANLTEEERAEFRLKVREHIQASFDQRMTAAQRLEAEGVNATLVAEFLAFAEGQKAKFAQATNNTVRKELIVEFNQKWREFKQAAQKDLHQERLQQAVDKAKAALAKLNELIARLKAAGYDVARLEAASAKISARLDSAASAETFRQGVAELKAAHKGFVYLKQAVRKVLQKQAVEEYTEERLDNAEEALEATPTPTSGASASPSPAAEASATPTPAATATPHANASANVSAGVNVSVG